LRATQAAILVDVLMEIDPHDPAVERRYVGSNGSDHARLRGLPAIGPGVSGAMHGTDPLSRASGEGGPASVVERPGEVVCGSCG